MYGVENIISTLPPSLGTAEYIVLYILLILVCVLAVIVWVDVACIIPQTVDLIQSQKNARIMLRVDFTLHLFLLSPQLSYSLCLFAPALIGLNDGDTLLHIYVHCSRVYQYVCTMRSLMIGKVLELGKKIAANVREQREKSSDWNMCENEKRRV